MIQERDYNDPLYKKFRQDVLRRDGWKCQWPDCGSRKLLRVHHIRTWAEYPALRFILSNGISLCKSHHDAIWGREENYFRLFFTILNTKGKLNDKRSRQQSKTANDGRVSQETSKSKKTKKSTKSTKSYAKRYIEAKRRRARKKG